MLAIRRRFLDWLMRRGTEQKLQKLSQRPPYWRLEIGDRAAHGADAAPCSLGGDVCTYQHLTTPSRRWGLRFAANPTVRDQTVLTVISPNQVSAV